MGKVLIIDISKCNGCHNCQIACKDEHVGNDWSPVAKPQPMTGQFWTKVYDKVRGSVPKVKVSYLHSICRHCDEAPCIKACSNKAIYKRPDGIVIIDPEKCQGSKDCIRECPFDDVIYFNEELNIAQKCTFCAHLIDKGWDETRCSDACPTGAFTFGDEEKLQDLIAKADQLTLKSGEPESSLRPRVYFIGIPKRFIGATIFDPEEDEVIIGADVNIISVSGGNTVSVKTDDFGDFWVDGLLPDKYEVEIKKSGYKTIKMQTDTNEADINLGDIPMQAGNG
ncbi:MAG: carboxypeptidase regulatory-like domain-containing protein [Spirochaetes bacterium]|nr:carboxypeptidase regulatory-like domain-containing protein [Spirochaetota bacterium]